MSDTELNIPAHIPADLVYDFDIDHPPGAEHDVHRAWHRLHAEAPDIFWTPRHGGHWIVTRAEDIEVMQLDHERFSHQCMTVPKQNLIRQIPLELDPPEHTPFRALLSPEFGPRRVMELERDARTLIRELIDTVYSKGGCDFVKEVSQLFPISIFLRLVDLPMSDREELLECTDSFVRARSPEERVRAQNTLVNYVGKYIAERRANPGPDLFSKMVNATVNGRPYTPEETFGLLVVVLFGGLDTVSSAMAFTVRGLIEYPNIRRQLAADHSLIPAAIEEMLRRHGIPNTARVVTHDFIFKGVQFRQNDSIVISKTLHGLDDRRYPDPLEIKLDRGPLNHAAFGNGPHRCAGVGLARMELRVFLEEWLDRIPDFELAPGKPPVTASGSINGITSLPIVWDVK